MDVTCGEWEVVDWFRVYVWDEGGEGYCLWGAGERGGCFRLALFVWFPKGYQDIACCFVCF